MGRWRSGREETRNTVQVRRDRRERLDVKRTNIDKASGKRNIKTIARRKETKWRRTRTEAMDGECRTVNEINRNYQISSIIVEFQVQGGVSRRGEGIRGQGRLLEPRRLESRERKAQVTGNTPLWVQHEDTWLPQRPRLPLIKQVHLQQWNCYNNVKTQHVQRTIIHFYP